MTKETETFTTDYGKELTKADEPREDWEMPEPPDCECDDPEVYPEANNTGSYWALMWVCGNCFEHLGNIQWPFGKDEFVTAEQLEELDFEVV